MPNEREVRLGLVGDRQALCSVTGRRCKCGDGDSCRAYRESSHNLPNELVRRIKTLWVHLDIARQDALDIADYDDQVRIWPQPEIRDIERRIETCIKTIEDILK
jgi:hypothetical protein